MNNGTNSEPSRIQPFPAAYEAVTLEAPTNAQSESLLSLAREPEPSADICFSPPEMVLPAPIVQTGFHRSSFPAAQSQARVTADLSVAVGKRDVRECERLAVRSGELQEATAVPLLCEMLQLQRRQWTRARLAAIRALEQIGAEHALPALAQAVLDPEPDVQAAAAQALLAVGPNALPALNAVLHRSGDWTLSGMKRLVTLFGLFRTPHASAALVSVVMAGLPAPPARWERPLVYSIRATCALVVTGALLIGMASGSVGGALLALFLLAIVGTFLWFMLALVGILPYRAMREGYERNAIAMIAAEGLRVSGDKAFLSAVVEGAFGYNRMSPRPARRALRYLLPRVTPEDSERITFSARSKLMDALNKGHGPDMDLAILTALEHLGTGSVADKVARLAQRGANPAIRDEAARILPILQMRRQQEQAPATLLRASSLATPADQLLRPGLPADHTPAEQLLRPGNGN